MRRLFGALVALVVAGATAHAQEQSVTGPCATPDSVAVRGNARITDVALRGDAGIVAGAPLNYRLVQRAIQRLYATGQFEDVSVMCERANDKTVVAIVVRERPLLGSVKVTGVEQVSASAVNERVGVLPDHPVDPALVAHSVARIDSLYEASGYYLAVVHVDTTLTDGRADLVFRIDEGRRLAVSGVRIEGNAALSDRTIVSAMKTKPEGFLWWKKGEFSDDSYAGDLTDRIPTLYAQNGYIDLQVTHDTVIVDRERGKALLVVNVAEGPRYDVGNFEVTGAKVFRADVIRRFYPFGERRRTLRETVTGIFKRRPDPNAFDRQAWEEATRQVQTAYANEGYIYATVRPVVDRRTEASGRQVVDLRWEIDERSPAIVNRVEILGNDVTVDNCIRDQIVVLPGDVYSQDLLIRSYQSIANLGFFETPLPPPDTRQANDQGDVDIIFRVKEKHTGNVNFGASVGQGYGLGGFIGFDQPNLFGMCKRGSLNWQFGKYVNDFNLGFTDPRIKGSQISGTVNAYHSRSQFIIRNIGRSTRTGASLRFGFPVRGSRWTRLFLDYGGEQVQYGDQGLVSTIPCGNRGSSDCFRSSLGATLDRDTRIDMPFPSAGVHQALSTNFTGGPLGGAAAYQRLTAEMRTYSTLASFGGGQPGMAPMKLVFGLGTKMGALFGDPGPFFVSQQFSLGGVQYGEVLRGYEEFSITPRGYISSASQTQADRQSFGSAFFTSTMELGLRFNQQMYVSAFYDAGNLWNKPRDFDPSRLFRGAGVGVALVTPLGPLGIDLGYGFDRTDAQGRPDPRWQVHFKFGQFAY